MSPTASALSQNALFSSQIAQQSAGQSSAQKSKMQSASSATAASTLSPAQKSKAQLNAQIMEASAKVSLSSSNQAQALFFQSTAANIAGQLNMGNTQIGFNLSYTQMQFGMAVNGFQTMDNSPEATSGRILNFATSFFKGYQAQNAGKNPNDVLQSFVSQVRTGFEKGFNEAKGILQSLNVFQGDTQMGIEKTYSLVQKGFDQFLNQKMNANAPTTAPITTTPLTTAANNPMDKSPKV